MSNARSGAGTVELYTHYACVRYMLHTPVVDSIGAPLAQTLLREAQVGNRNLLFERRTQCARKAIVAAGKLPVCGGKETDQSRPIAGENAGAGLKGGVAGGMMKSHQFCNIVARPIGFGACKQGVK